MGSVSQNVWAVAAVWMALAAASSLIAARLRLAAALVEILLGITAGNAIGLHTTQWIDFIAGFGSVMLTFLAGAEIDPVVLRAQLLPSLTIGAVSFLAPFLAALAFAYYGAHWDVQGAKIAGVAMSTTSVAVVYAVLVESGVARRDFGQLILAACFFTDLGTVVALGILFASYNWWLALLVAAIAVAVFLVPKALPALLERTSMYVSEPGVRVLLTIVAVLAALATQARSEGVLPAYFLGLACAGLLFRNRDLKRRLQTMTLTLFAPFYFLKAGTFVSLPAALAGAGLIATLFVVKVVAKIAGVWPVARAFAYPSRESSYLTLMMATGLTFGTISSLYGLAHGFIDRAQYTALVTVVILTAVVPTVVAQVLFHPHDDPFEAAEEVP